MKSLLSSLVLLSVGLTNAQFVTPPKDLIQKTGFAGLNVRYKEVPAGICEQDPNVKSYTGYVDVAEDQHIFFWFFEARNGDPCNAPLTSWINGGPGASTMIGLFQELGPCGIDYDGNVYNNPYSWSNVSNMLFIDQPTTTGFSYSIPVPGYTDPNSNDIILLPNETCPDYAAACGTYNTPNQTLTANSTTAAAPNFWKTLQGFMGAFPQYSQNGYFFTSESYGGHYGPIFSDYILKQNENLPAGAQHIDLRGVLIGNGWFEPILQYEAYYNYSSSSPGNTYIVPELAYNASIDAQVYNSMYGKGNCLDMLKDCNRYPYATNSSDGEGNGICSAADTWCYNNIENPYDIVTGRDEYDVRYYTPNPFPYSFFVDYLNQPEVQAAIGAYVNFSKFSDITANAFGATGDDAREIGVTEAVEDIICHGVTFVMYFGDADYNCNWLGGQAFSHILTGSAAVEAYNTQAGFANISTSDDVLHGVVKGAGKFSFVRIYYSGHEVPFYQPLVSLEMLNRTLLGYDIATGETKLDANYITTGPKESTFQNGGDTVTIEIVPLNATYNITTNKPNPFNGTDDGTAPPGAKHEKKSPGMSSRAYIAKKRSEAKREYHERALEFAAYEEKMADLRRSVREPWHYGDMARKSERIERVRREEAMED